MASPASRLEGLTLDGGWVVTQRIQKDPGQTGGNFSEGYFVISPNGTKAFLKALDYSRAMQAKDPAQELLKLTQAYVHERDLVARCKRMDRVVTGLTDGSVTVGGEVVQYLVFELADCDIRRFLDLSKAVEEAWILRALHHVATGLRQLHSGGVAHQDLKPSNVVVFSGAVSKIADLGRATQKGVVAPHEHFKVAGDPQYAPPELLYGYIDPEWSRRRLGCDAYHLGSLVVFLFARVNMTHLLLAHLDPAHRPGAWSGSFAGVLPYLRVAFDLAMRDFIADLATLHEGLRSALESAVRELCEPDPDLRGSPRSRGGINQFSLDRYVTRFDLLASRAAAGAFR